MNGEASRQEILKRILVTRQRVTLAKAYLRNLPRDKVYDSGLLINEFAAQQGHQKPNKILLHPSADVETQIKQASEYFIDVLAAIEALWALIHGDELLHFGNFQGLDTSLEWTTVTPGHGGVSAGWTFEEFYAEMPSRIAFAPSYRNDSPQTLTDPDLFILEAGIDGADSEVIEAVQDAIRCFRHELYRPAVTILGKAMEGAWIEVGIALANSVPEGSSFKKDKFLSLMTDESSTISKIHNIVELYKNKDFVGHVVKASKVNAQELQNILIWSDVLREARNAIHFGVKPTIPNTYEKVAVLLLAAAKNLAKLYHIKKVAEQVSEQ